MKYLQKIVLIALVLITAGGIYFFYYRRQAAEFEREYQSANESHAAADYDTAVTNLKVLMEKAPTRQDQEAATWKLASSLIFRDKEGDRVEAIRLFEEIANDSQASARSRAFSLNGIAFTYDLTGDEEFMRNAVFNKEPYATYLRETRTGIHGGIRKIYEGALKLFPNTFSKIEIANHYAIPMQEGLFEDGLNRGSTSDLIRKYLAEGTPALRTYERLYQPDMFAYLLRLHASSLVAVYESTQSVGRDEVESAFKEAIAAAQRSAEADENGKRVLYSARLHYAAFLAKNHGSERAPEIKKLTEPLTTSHPPYSQEVSWTRSMLTSIGQRPRGDYLQQTYTTIVGIDNDFRLLLLELGWKLN